MTRKLSRWSKPGEKPPMVGVWETECLKTDITAYNYWDGKSYGPSQVSIREAYKFRNDLKAGLPPYWRFRGLATKPENDDATE